MTHPVTLTSPVLALSLARVQRLVGGKTTLRLTNSQNFGFREGPDETLLSHLRSAASLTAYKRMRQGDPSVQMMAFHPSFVEHMSRIFDKHIPTSGLYGIILSLQMCKRVSLFGFHVSASHGVKYHYYDVCDRPANVRRDSIEWYAVKALSQGRVVRFKEDCVMECNVNRYQCRTCKKERKFKDVEDYGPAERKGEPGCPKCSAQVGGCKPGQGGKPKMHWAFSSNWKTQAPAFGNAGGQRRNRGRKEDGHEHKSSNHGGAAGPAKPAKHIVAYRAPPPLPSPPSPPPPPPSPPPPVPSPPPPTSLVVRQIDPKYGVGANAATLTGDVAGEG